MRSSLTAAPLSIQISDDYLCHYGVLGMKWGQHLMAKKKQAKAERKANIATGKGITSNVGRRIRTAADIRAGVVVGTMGITTGLKTAAELKPILASNAMAAYNGSTLGKVALTAATSSAPYVAGALALGAVSGLSTYAISKHLTDNMYAKRGKAYNAKDPDLRKNEYIDEHGEVRDKNTKKLVYY